MLVPDSKYFEQPIVNPRYLKKNYPEFTEYLYSHYPQVRSIAEALYMWRFGLTERPVCAVCGNPVKFYGINKGFAECCSYECSNKNSVEKSKKTKEIKYGDPNYNNRSKAAETCLIEYGVDNPFKSESVKEQIKETCKAKWGYEYSAQVPELIEKKNNTFQTNHQGLTSPLQLEKTKINRDISRTQSVLKKHGDVIDVDVKNKLYICSCPHEGCDKCQLKTYTIKPSAYFDRKRDKTEPCTNILPFDSNHNQGISIEIFIRRILDDHNIPYECNVKSILSNSKEIDVFVPSHNLAIECNGIYWHSLKPTQYHYNKWSECKDNQIQLMSIWEDWIINKPNVVESIILSKLGIYKERIGARECEIKEINSKQCNEFLELNHIQGLTKANIHIGLYKNNELVSVMTFGHKRAGMGNRLKSEKEYELSRFCTKINVQVISGAEKLLKYFIKKYNPSAVYSFSSNDISNGDLYKKLGFSKSTQSLSYWYVYSKGFKRYHRSTFTKSNIVRLGWRSDKNGWTESEVMLEHGYMQIYDSGTTKWVLNL